MKETHWSENTNRLVRPAVFLIIGFFATTVISNCLFKNRDAVIDVEVNDYNNGETKIVSDKKSGRKWAIVKTSKTGDRYLVVELGN